MTPCSLCERPVLGLTGHDWNLLPWMVAPGDESGAGPGHVRCLLDLGAGRRWAAAVQDYHCLRWPQWRTGAAAGVRWRLHCAPRARRFHLWRADGRLSSFPFSAFAGRTRNAVPVLSEIAEVGGAYSEVLLRAIGRPEIGVPIRLAGVVGALGLADRYPGADGVLTRPLEKPGILEASYRLRLDTVTLRAAAELVRALV